MTEKPLVTVIINCYNSEKYLRETIDSLIAQTYENWEAIFWDNCSTDKTSEIIASYKEPRFRYFLAEKNTPLGEARNLAMEKVQGEYFCFLDSDDVWMPEFLSIGIRKFIDNRKIVAFYSNYLIWDAKGKKIFNKTIEKGIHSYKTILTSYGIGMSACIVSYNLVKYNNIKFNDKYQLIEDFDFFLKIADYGDFYYDDQGLCLYRVHSSSTTIKLKNQWASEYEMLYEELMDSVKTNNKHNLDISDLNRIKDSIFYWKSSNLKDQGKRNELAVLLWNNKSLIKKHSYFLLYVILGPWLYDILKKIVSSLKMK